MAIVPHTVDTGVKDMGRVLAFYRLLGLVIPAEADLENQVQVDGAPGFSLGFVTEEMVREAVPGWPDPVGQRQTVAFSCDTAAELDAAYARLAAAGHGLREPWDSFWGQRYAFLRDADGNRVDLFAPLG